MTRRMRRRADGYRLDRTPFQFPGPQLIPIIQVTHKGRGESALSSAPSRIFGIPFMNGYLLRISLSDEHLCCGAHPGHRNDAKENFMQRADPGRPVLMIGDASFSRYTSYMLACRQHRLFQGGASPDETFQRLGSSAPSDKLG